MELNIQSYLRSGKSVEDLGIEFGVYTYEHPSLPLVGFKYGLITSDSQKFHPIVRESRGIVLERGSWNVVAYPFKRFFNLGEDPATEECFNWNNFSCQEKLDGSLIIVYHYDGDWHVNTSGSFAQGICYDSGRSWEELFWETFKTHRGTLIPEMTYIFELWTKYNKIVRSYDKSFVTLLGVRDNKTLKEFSHTCIRVEADFLNVNKPKLYHFKSVAEIVDKLENLEQQDPTFEGFVLCDRDFRRIKIKSDSYKQLHALKGNGQFLYKNIIPQLLKGNRAKLARDFPEWLEELEQCSEKIDHLKSETNNLWSEFGEMQSRRDYAQNILRYASLPAMLFWLYDKKYNSVEEAFQQSEDYLVKYFEGKK